VSDWHLPLAHYLESWGDARTSDGTLVPVQPLIEPLFGGLTELELLARIGGQEKLKPHDIVRETFRGIGGEDEDNWKRFLHDGFLAGSAARPTEVRFNPAAAANIIGAAKPVAAPTPDALEVVFHRDYKVDDGRYNNNGWLQELPDPVTKLTWENVILLSPRTADSLGLVIQNKENNQLFVPLVRIQLDGREIVGPAWKQPGMADNVVGLASVTAASKLAGSAAAQVTTPMSCARARHRTPQPAQNCRRPVKPTSWPARRTTVRWKGGRSFARRICSSTRITRSSPRK